MSNSDVLKEIQWDQPNKAILSPVISEMLNQFWVRVERLTAITLSDEERKIVDARLCTLALELKECSTRFKANHPRAIAEFMVGKEYVAANEKLFTKVA